MTAQDFQNNEQDPSAPVLGIPVEQNNQKNSINSLPVISEGFCVPHDVVFVLQSNLNPRSTEIYNIIDSAGTPQFKVHAAHGSGSEMVITSTEGRVILTLKSKSFSVHNKWYIFSGNSTNKDDKIATVKPHENSESAEEDGYSRPVAELNKIKPDIKRGQPIPTNIDAYSLHTMPGIDSVFMLAVTVALDESIFGVQAYGYGGIGSMGYGGMGYGGMGYGYGGGLGYGGLGYGGMFGAPLLLGGGLGLGAGMMMGGMGGFW
ncbi:MAG: hypothetical protein FRX49_08320 [Trebouxia sp. A1-2]|nr:MAG: hypothetical protein FRX49_08320 [Trebouxia sp. A1-2]